MNRLRILFLIIPLIFLLSSCENDEDNVNMPIVLITDFGEGNFWIGELKGMILNTFYDAIIIDGTHSVTAFDSREGAYLVETISKQYPEDVVFIAIVDPGVPKKERYLVLLTHRNQLFLAPDNGLLTYIYYEQGIKELYHITNDALFDEPIESLFVSQILGRIGGLIASGFPLEDIGPQITDPIKFNYQEPSISGDTLIGKIIYIDKYGNCITNFEDEFSNPLGFSFRDSVDLITDDTTITAMFGTIYGDVPFGDPVVFVNYHDVMEISINMGNFAEIHRIEMGESIKVTKSNE